eukprot:15458283-Alexandrium_andersonii.AAC.1
MFLIKRYSGRGGTSSRARSAVCCWGIRADSQCTVYPRAQEHVGQARQRRSRHRIAILFIGSGSAELGGGARVCACASACA